MKALTGLALSSLPPVAAACPVCASGDGGPGGALLVGLLIAAPYLVAALVIRAIRRGEEGTRP
jgi:hypothetical protein